VDGWCRGDGVVWRVNDMVGFEYLGGRGGGEGRLSEICVYVFFFGLEKDFGAHICFRMVLGTTSGWDKKL